MKTSAFQRVIFIALTAAAVISVRAESNDSVTTHEGEVQVSGERFQQIEFGGHVYFMKASRPGSHLVEVVCAHPGGVSEKSNATLLKTTSRSGAFAKRLVEGCAAKQGVLPDRFTFEETPAPSRSGATPTPKPFKAHAYPSELDPHVIPEPVDPASEFPARNF